MTASPQLEDGHTRIANELIEAMLLAKLTSRQWAVIIALIRKTYGYNKKTDDIGLSQLVELTGLAKPHVSVTVRELEDRRIITRKQGQFGHIMGVNKNHSQWIVEDKKQQNRVTEVVPVTETVTVTELDNEGYQSGKTVVTETVTTKDNHTKDNKQKKAPRQKILFKTWLDQCREQGIDPIDVNDAIFNYASDVNLTIDHIRMVWIEFKRKYSEADNKYKSWPHVFRNAVRENWYNLWYDKNGKWELTTRGKQLEKELRGRQQNE